MIQKHFVLLISLFFCLRFSFGQILNESDDIISAPTIDLQDSTFNTIPVVVSKIIVEGNRITKERIVLRELFFKLNDTIPANQLKEILIRSRQNLLNSSLFNFVSLTHVLKGESVEIKISVVERWYTFPIPLFELADPNFNTWWLTKDFGRAFYGVYLLRENFRGLKESLRFKVQFGYTEQFALQYTVPYINKKQTIGLGFTTSYSRNKEVAIKTINNKRVLYRDFGKYVRDEFYSTAVLSLRNDIYNTHSVQFKYNNVSIDKTISGLTDDYLKNNNKKAEFLMFGYSFIRDKSDFKSYPLSGYYTELELIKYGSGLLKEEPDFAYLSTRLKKFWKLNPRWYYAVSAMAKQSLYGRQPYYLQKGLGYADNVRSYEYYIVDGQSWYMAKNNFKYRLISPKVQKLQGINNNKINLLHYTVYLNVFADAGYVRDTYYNNLNSLSNTLLFGYGIGLDYVTYYDRTIRLEYSINRMGQGGFYININAPL